MRVPRKAKKEERKPIELPSIHLEVARANESKQQLLKSQVYLNKDYSQFETNSKQRDK